MKIPFNDLSRIHKPIKKNVIKVLDNSIDNSEFILSSYVKSFEESYSNYTNSNYTISCSNGTDAIELVLRALDIGVGDEVILPTNTFIATALAVSRTGAKPVLVDNDPFYLIDVEKIEKEITKKTKAIIGVHLYGQQVENITISNLCKKYNLEYIEDSAQAHGSKYKSYSPGKYGTAATYSFYPGKNLGAWGDAGAITTDNKALNNKLQSLRNWGSKKKYIHNEIGFNSRMNTLQAIVLKEKLKYIDSWNKDRRTIAQNYIKSLSHIDRIVLPETKSDNDHVWHLFVIRVPNRKSFFQFMESSSIELGIHYPFPIHKQKAYTDINKKNKSFENADSFHNKLVSLPIFPKMTEKEQDYVIENIKKFFN